MRLSFYTFESLTPYETPEGLRYITRSGAELTADTAAISPDAWGNFPECVWIPALQLAGQPAFRVVQDTGYFTPEIIDVFLPVESNAVAMAAIEEIGASGSPFVELRKEVAPSGREYVYVYVKVYACTTHTPSAHRSRHIPEHF